MTLQSPPYNIPAPPGVATKGFILNIDKLIGLRFMFNPTEIEHSKTPVYEFESQEGWDFPIIRWKSGGVYKIRFSLVSDHTNDAVSSGVLSYVVPFLGTQGVKAVIESFMASQSSLGMQIPIENPFTDAPPRRMYPPPDCYLLMGSRFWRTKLVQAPLREILFDKYLTPVRMLSQLEFVVIEEGTLDTINKVAAQSFAVMESLTGISETIADFVKVF